jgi:Protein of unknown function (DUF3810)
VEYSTAPRWPFLLLPGAAALQLAGAAAPSLVERAYSQGIYRAVAAAFAFTTGRLPFSVGEVLLVLGAIAVVVWMAAVVRGIARARDGRRAIVARALAQAWIGAGAFYLAFVLLWGLNYRRRPYAELAGLDTRPSAVPELASVCDRLIREANAARESLPEDAAGVARLAGGRSEAMRRAPEGYREVGRDQPALAGASARAKPVRISTLLSYLGISGIFCPFTGEANVNTTLPEPDVPFASCHELAHAQGFAREDEANYIGYVACTRHPDADFRYSGLLGASVYAMNALYRADRPRYAALEARRSAGVRRDLQALVAWSERYRGPAERASRAVNNAYLKMQGQPDGVRSYGRMVDLLIAEQRPRLTASRSVD